MLIPWLFLLLYIFLRYFPSDCPGGPINLLIYCNLVCINVNLITILYKNLPTVQPPPSFISGSVIIIEIIRYAFSAHQHICNYFQMWLNFKRHSRNPELWLQYAYIPFYLPMSFPCLEPLFHHLYFLIDLSFLSESLKAGTIPQWIYFYVHNFNEVVLSPLFYI